MRREMRKPCDMFFKRFTERLTEINNFIPFFPVPESTKKIPPE